MSIPKSTVAYQRREGYLLKQAGSSEAGKRTPPAEVLNAGRRYGCDPMKYPKEIPPRPNDFQPRPFSKFPPLDLRQLRTGCRDYSETEVGGRVAGVCVVCGRAACSWTVYVPGNPEFSILSLDREASSRSGPEDGAYPIKSMIESMRFDSTRPRQSSSLPIRTAPY